MKTSKFITSLAVMSVTLGATAFTQKSKHVCDLKVTKGPKWDLEATTELPWHDYVFENCTTAGFGHADAGGAALGKTVTGDGEAYDYCTGDDVRAQVAGTGLYSQVYDYIGSKRGAVRWTATLAIRGAVHLRDDDCAGAALGYVEYYCTGMAQRMQAVLNESAAETTAVGLGDLTFALGDLTITVTPTVSTGLGDYRDNDVIQDTDEDCWDRFYYSTRSRAYVEFWANSFGLGSSDVDGNLSGEVCGTIVLFEEEPSECP